MQRRLTALAVLASSIAVLLFAVPLAVAAARSITSDEGSELQRIAATVSAGIRGDLSPSALANNPALRVEPAVTIYDHNGVRLVGPGPERGGSGVTAALTGQSDTRRADGRMTATVAMSDGDVVVAAIAVSTPLSELNRRIAVAWAEMGAGAVIAVGLTGLVARRYSRRLSRPLEQLATFARRAGDGHRESRPALSSIVEIDTIAEALTASIVKLYAANDRERRFTADVSHQLRTPIAGLRLELEAALLDRTIAPQLAIAQAIEAADRLQSTVDTLLTLARDHPVQARTELTALLDGIAQRWNGRLALDNRPLRIDRNSTVPPTIGCSAGAAEQILDILLDNATRHGHGPVSINVRLLADAVAIDVTNPGPAIAGPTSELFDRYNSHASGSGIGLPLARTLAEAEGGRLMLAATDPPTFTVLMPIG